MAPCCSHTVGNYFGLYQKSLSQKLTEKLDFFCKIDVCDPFVTFTVTAGHRSWWEMKGYI